MNTKSRQLFGRGRQLKTDLRKVQIQRQQEAAGKLPRTQELMYGGLKICAVAAPSPPAETTRPSGRSIAVE